MKQIVFHSGTTSVNDGEKFMVRGYKTLTIGIAGTSTSRTIAFKGVDAAGNVVSMPGYKLPAASTEASSTTGTGETWQFDLEPYVAVYFAVTAVSGGTVIVVGKVVA